MKLVMLLGVALALVLGAGFTLLFVASTGGFYG